MQIYSLTQVFYNHKDLNPNLKKAKSIEAKQYKIFNNKMTALPHAA